MTIIDTGPAARALDLERALLAQIPLARAMALSIADYDGDALTISAPLAPNINDKGCAFGGSLASLLTLAGWSLIRLACEARSLDPDIYVQESSITYLAPVWNDFRARATLAAGESFDGFFSSLQSRGKGRLRIEGRVPLDDGSVAATFAARFVAIAKA